MICHPPKGVRLLVSCVIAYAMRAVTLFEQQDNDLEQIASFWNEVSAENWLSVVMAVIAPCDCDCGIDISSTDSAECRIAVAKGKLGLVFTKAMEFCEPRGIKIVSHSISGHHLDIAVSPKERATDLATHLEMLNGACVANRDFMLRRRNDAWAIGATSSDIAIAPAGISNFKIKRHTANYTIEYMSQVVGDEWRGGRASIHGFLDFMNWRMKYIASKRDRMIARAIINNIRENEEVFKEEATDRYLKRVEKYLQNPDSFAVSPEEYAWAMRQMAQAKCHFDGKELNIKVQLTGAEKEIDIVPYDLGPNAERVKVKLGLNDDDGYVNVDALRKVLVQIREVIMQSVNTNSY